MAPNLSLDPSKDVIATLTANWRIKTGQDLIGVEGKGTFTLIHGSVNQLHIEFPATCLLEETVFSKGGNVIETVIKLQNPAPETSTYRICRELKVDVYGNPIPAADGRFPIDITITTGQETVISIMDAILVEAVNNEVYST